MEELQVLYSEAAPTVTRYRITHGEGVERLQLKDGYLVAWSMDTQVVARTALPFALDADGRKLPVSVTLDEEGDGYQLAITVDTDGGEFPIILDPEWVAGAGWPTDAIVALNSIRVDDNATVVGSITVIDQAPGATLGNDAQGGGGGQGGFGGGGAYSYVEVRLEPNATVQDDATAHRVTLAPNAHVQGTIYGDEIDCTTGCTGQPLPGPLPLDIMVPAVPAFTAATGNDSWGTSTKAQGEYGVVTVGAGAAVTLSGGLYHLESLTIGAQGSVSCAFGEHCEMRIADNLTIEDHGWMYHYGVGDFEVFVMGENAVPTDPTSQPAAVETAAYASLRVRLFAPNGTIRVGPDLAVSEATLVGRDVLLGAGAYVRDDGGSSEPDCVAYCNDVMTAGQCPNGPVDQTDCVENWCKPKLTDGYCQHQMQEFVTCVAAASSGPLFECDMSTGEPVIKSGRQSCLAVEDLYYDCRDYCAGADDGQPCSIDTCECIGNDCSIEATIGNTTAPYGVSCSNGNPCDGEEYCDGLGTATSNCKTGPQPDIDDGNDCTADHCTQQNGVTHTFEPLNTPCGPSTDICNGVAKCDGAGTCQPGAPVVVDDKVATTLDWCDPTTGDPQHSDISTEDGKVATDIFDSSQFLYDPLGNAIQSGVNHQIAKERAAVIRGSVNMAGVAVRVLGDPDYGTTVTYPDPEPGGLGYTFSMVVNGGARFTVVFEKDGYLPVHRAVKTSWREYGFTDDVVMKPYDHIENVITFNSPVMQVARGSQVDDGQGARRATLLVPAGTDHDYMDPKDDLPPPQLGSMTVRLTEYTVGADGPDAMPARLPGASAYTYAVELSADEAVAQGAESVKFTKDVILYVDNYLDFEVGRHEPFGYYDRKEGHWVAEKDGLVLAIVGESGGLALLDLDGDGIEDDGNYTDLSIEDEERLYLAQLYEPGDELWRVTMNHFTPGDLNLGLARGLECLAGGDDCPLPAIGEAQPEEGACTQEGSIIECQNQTVGQRIPIKGTPYALHYQSDRTPGFEAARHLEIPFTPDAAHPLPAGIKRVLVEVDVAGRRIRTHEEVCPCAPDLVHSFTWDGKDAWGRVVQGPQPAVVRIGYTFVRDWMNSNFNSSANPVPFTFGSWPPNQSFSTEQNMGLFKEYAVWTEYRVGLGTWNSVKEGLGGFSIDVHHAYSPSQRTLYLGNGQRRRDTGRGAVINFVAGRGLLHGSGVGEDAIDTNVGYAARGMATGADGTLYMAVVTGNPGYHSVASIQPNGEMHYLTQPTYVVTTCQSSVDGQASTATVCDPRDVAVGPDGSIYVAETGADKIRKIDPAADTISTVAQLDEPRRVDIGPDGSIFILHKPTNTPPVVRRVSTAGIVSRVAGGGSKSGSCPERSYELLIEDDPDNDIAVGPDGSLFVSSSYNLVYRISPDGTMAPYAGSCTCNCSQPSPCVCTSGVSGDYGPATQAEVDNPTGLHVTENGTLYIAVPEVNTNSEAGVRRVSPEGIITTVVGGPDLGNCYDPINCGVPGPATEVDLGYSTNQSIAIAPSGQLYLFVRRYVYNVSPAFPGPSDAHILVPSRDGMEVYEFDQRGQHLFTKDAVTGATLYEFGYDDDLLTGITDVNGHTTTIGHSGNKPTSVVGPFGHKTGMQDPDSSGFIQTVGPPEISGSYGLSYDADGLLTTFEEPTGNVKTYSYFESGQGSFGGLLKGFYSYDPYGARATDRTLLEKGYEVSLTHATNPATNKTTYRVETEPDGSEVWTTSHPVSANDTVTTTTKRLAGGGTQTTFTDQTTKITVTPAADPRFLMQSPVPAEVKLQTGTKDCNPDCPTVYTERNVTLSAPTDPLSVTQWSQTTCLNGPVSGTSCSSADAGVTLQYDKGGDSCSGGADCASGTCPSTTNVCRDAMTRTTNAGRTAYTDLDDQGRPVLIVTKSDSLGIDLANISLAWADGTSDPNGYLDSVSYVHASGSRTYSFDYDGAGNLVSITDPLNRTVTLTPDTATRVVDQEFPTNVVVGFGWDDNDNLTSLDPAGGGGSGAGNEHGFEYNGVNLVKQYDAPAIGLSSHSDTYGYNGDRQLTELLFNATGQESTITPSYDAYGRLDDVTLDAYNQSAWTLDVAYVTSGDHLGKMQSITSSRDNVTVGLTYDGLLVDDVTWSGSGIAGSPVLDYAYDAALRVTGETVDSEPQVSFQYNDADGLLTKAGDLDITRDPDTGIITATSLSPGTPEITDATTPNPFGELEEYSVAYDDGAGGAAATTKYHVTYQRDDVGRVETKSETVDGTTTYHGYTYDSAGRLDEVFEGTTAPCVPPSMTNCVSQASYGYDDNGNRTNASCQHDEQDRIDGTCEGMSHTYTDWGALLTKGAFSFTYDLLGNLRHVTVPGSGSANDIDYVVDPAGRRVGKKVGGVAERYWIYRDALNPVAELDSSGNVTAVFVYGTKPHVPDYMIKGGDLYRLVTDQLGSVILVVELSTGDIAQEWSYDPWGVATLESAPGTEDFQPFGYAGGLYDHDTGLVRFGARDYDPQTGRWTTKDPIGFGGGQANLYAYSYNDPVNNIDPSGLFVDAFTILDAYDLAQGLAKIASGCATTGDYVSTFLAGAGLILPVVGGLGSAVSRVWPRHHPFPKYLGGAAGQTLKKIPRKTHEALHSALDKWMGGKYARSKGASHFKDMDNTQIIEDLRDFYKSANGGAFQKYLPDFEQAVMETLGGL